MGDASDFEALGLYDPQAPDADDRLAALRYLGEQGATLEEMVLAQARGRLLALAGDRLLQPDPARYAHAELAARPGLTPELLERVRRAAGFAPVDPAERRFSDAEVDAFAAFRPGAELLGEEPLLDFTRVLGSSLARIAESAVSLFLVNIEEPLRRAGGGQLDLARANRDAFAALALLPPTMAALLREHLHEAIRRSDAARGPERSPNTVRMAVGFVDLVGFTAISERLSAHELAALVRDFEARAHDLVTANAGRVVKLIGDEVMFVALDARAACKIALALVETFRDDAPRVTPRGGLAIGPLLARGGDYYGPIVNLASRIAELAVPFEVLVTPACAAEAHGYHFEPAGRRMLKGFTDPVQLLSAGRR